MLLALVAGASVSIGRRGYSVDEEFTVFAVSGIRAGGLPRLPSGLLYDRGLAFSYASWLAGEALGHTLPVYRALALVSAAGALLAVTALVRTAAGGPAAVMVLLLVAASLPFWAAATTARFYAPFLLLYVLALRELLRLRSRNGPSVRARVLPLVILAFLARLTHELAFSLAAIPAAILLLRLARGRVRGPADLSPWMRPTLVLAAGLAAAQGLLVLLHYLAPAGGDTMIRRFFLWQLFNLFGSPMEALDFAWHIARTWPVLTLSVMGLLAARILGAGRPWSGPERFAHVLWMGWVLFFGLIDSGITINYLLVPVTFMLAALAVDLAAVVPRRILPYASTVLVALLAVEQWGLPPAAASRLDAVRPTITLPADARLRVLLAGAPHIACTDELACLMLIGRVDTWLALDPFLRDRFVVRRNGREEGVYAASPVRATVAGLFEPEPGRTPFDNVVVVDVFKDLPIGPSSAFLPRAIAEAAGSVDARTVVQTPRLRVVELSRRSQSATPK